MSSFSGFKDGINYLRRRFSSNDLPNEPDAPQADEECNETEASAETSTTSPAQTIASSPTSFDPPKPPSTASTTSTSTTISNIKGSVISAPCSPCKGVTTTSSSSSTKSSEGLSFAKSLFGRSSSSKVSTLVSHHCDSSKTKVLLVIDDKDVPWNSYFIGKKIAGYDLKIEKFDFASLSVASSAVDGSVVHVTTKSASKSQFTRSFKPDFVLIRQKVCYLGHDYRSLVVSLIHGGVRGVQDLWHSHLFADVALLTCRLNDVAKKHNFPFIPGDFFCSHQDIERKIQNGSIEYPIVLKLGNHKAATGMIKIDNLDDLESIMNLTACDQSYCFIQEHVTAEYEVIVHKIGHEYRAFSRTSLDGKWNVSASKMIIEEVKVAERYSEWVEALSDCFDGMQICGLQILVSKGSKEFIIGAYDSNIPLIGDKQEEDHKNISQLTLKVLEKMLKESKTKKILIDKISEDPESSTSTPVAEECEGGSDDPPPTNKVSLLKSLSGGKSKETKSMDEVTSVKEEDGEDTMKNLRKTFAGIFGDM